MLEASLAELESQTQADKQKQKSLTDKMPPTSHTLMDLVITIAIYLPRPSFSTLFSLAAIILPQTNDPQLQKKAYKLLPRLATSVNGRHALADRNIELQQLLLSSAASASAPCRRDRLAAISVVVDNLPQDSLHFIPSILSEVVISAKEVNEKARTAAFDLLVLMGNKMSAGGTIVQSNIPHMPADAPTAQASLEEYFTMVSAGLAGSTPHMISASITALTRILYEFRAQLSEAVIEDLVQTMDLFLGSNSREIVRSVLGFVKVAVISLPEKLVRPRLETLVPGLMGWSKEHKAHFRAKVKHIFERMIRRFGAELVERLCPEDDRKLITNIRKTRERRKRKKDAAGDEEEEDVAERKKKGKFESEFDEAVYGSDEEDISDAAGSGSDDERGARRRKGGHTYIVEDEDEPLDLLDRKALGNISSTKPISMRQPPTAGRKSKVKMDLDGKLLLGGEENDDDNAMLLDFGGEGKSTADGREPGDGTLEGGINAYVDAIKGRDAVKRGRGGRLKFSNKRTGDGMEVDDDENGRKEVRGRIGMQPSRGRGGSGPGDRGRSGSGQNSRGGGRGGGGRGGGGPKFERKGLGVSKVSGGRVEKHGARRVNTGRGGRGGRR